MIARAQTAASPTPSRIILGAFYLFVCSIPFEFSDRDAQSLPIEIPTALGALFLLTTILQPRGSFGRPARPVWWFLLYMYAFFLAAAINGQDHVATILNGADYWQQVVKMTFQLTELILIFWVGRNLMRSPVVMERALIALALACVVRAAMPFVGIATTVHHVQTGGQRLSAMGQNSNHAAMILGAGLIALVGLTYGRYNRGRWRRLAGAPLLALLAIAVADTGSRGGILALALGTMAFMFQGGTLGQRIRNMALTLLVIAAIGVAAFQSEVMRNRFMDTIETGTLTGRELIYPAVVGMIRDRPLFGWGPANNKYELGLRLDERVRRRRGTHNSVLEVLSATGVVAAIPFLIGTWLCLWAAWRAREGPGGSLPLALTITVMASNMSGDWFITPLYWFVLAYAVASEGHTVQVAALRAPAWPARHPPPLPSGRIATPAQL
jgi:O-antigen ligase